MFSNEENAKLTLCYLLECGGRANAAPSTAEIRQPALVNSV
jgi:hypothetical protein